MNEAPTHAHMVTYRVSECVKDGYTPAGVVAQG